MILIVTEEADVTARFVIDWLDYLDKPFLKINTEDEIILKRLKISSNKIEFELSGNGCYKYEISSSEITSYWLRRGHLSLKLNIGIATEKIPASILEGVNSYLLNEYFFLQSAIHAIIESEANVSLDSLQTSANKKLENLLVARSSGFNIPTTAIIQSKESLYDFYYAHNQKIVAKGINESIMFDTVHGDSIACPTVLITREDIEECEDFFFPTLVQERICKIMDIRIFYLDGEIYSAALFTDPEFSHEVDYRVVDSKGENLIRIVPYFLTEDIRVSVITFMKSIGRKTGSIDLIKSKDGHFFFLEVNPVGQFGFISDHCNYYIEKKIAEYL